MNNINEKGNFALSNVSMYKLMFFAIKLISSLMKLSCVLFKAFSACPSTLHTVYKKTSFIQ